MTKHTRATPKSLGPKGFVHVRDALQRLYDAGIIRRKTYEITPPFTTRPPRGTNANTPQVTRLFQIKEDDLAALEEVLPKILDRQYPTLDAATRAKWRRVREIVCNVRWNYGPPIGDATVIPADDTTPPA